MADDERLSPMSRELIAHKQNAPLVSAASAWEIAIKFRLGRLPAAAELVRNFASGVEDKGIEILPINAGHAIRAGLLTGSHKDPFDRMLAAQALEEDVPILSNDHAFDEYGVHRLW